MVLRKTSLYFLFLSLFFACKSKHSHLQSEAITQSFQQESVSAVADPDDFEDPVHNNITDIYVLSSSSKKSLNLAGKISEELKPSEASEKSVLDTPSLPVEKTNPSVLSKEFVHSPHASAPESKPDQAIPPSPATPLASLQISNPVHQIANISEVPPFAPSASPQTIVFHKIAEVEDAFKIHPSEGSSLPLDTPISAVFHGEHVRVDVLVENGSAIAVVEKKFNTSEEALAAGKAALEQRNFAVAEKHLKEALELKPNDTEVQYQLAILYEQTKNFDEHLKYIRSASDGNHFKAQAVMMTYYTEGRAGLEKDLRRSKLLASKLLRTPGVSIKDKAELISYIGKWHPEILSSWLQDAKQYMNAEDYIEVLKAGSAGEHGYSQLLLILQSGSKPEQIEKVAKLYLIKDSLPKDSTFTRELDALLSKDPDFENACRPKAQQKISIIPAELQANDVSQRIDSDIAIFQLHPELYHSYTAEMIKDYPFLRPTTAYQVDGRKFFFSNIFKADLERDVVIAYTLNDSGKFVPRLFYKSRSDGGWRSCPDVALNGYLSKGNRFHYTQETKPHPDILNHLNAVAEDPQYVIHNQEHLKFARSLFLTMILPNDIRTFSYSIKYETPAGSEMEQFRLSMPGSCFEKSPTVAVGKSTWSEYYSSLKYPEGFLPDFSKQPVRVYKTEHTLLGKTTIYVFNAKLGSEDIEWHMARTDTGEVWIERISYTSAKVNSYGVADHIFNMGGLTQKPVEYKMKATYLTDSEKKEVKSEFLVDEEGPLYVDITPVLANMQPIKDFKTYHSH